MKKSLLLGLMAIATLSASALPKGEKVYTHFGRYQITGEANLCTNGNFAAGFEATGWNAISATAERKATEQFQFAGADETTGAPAGIKSIYSEPAEGMSYSINTLDPSTTYIVSMTIWAPVTAAGSTNFNTRLGETFDGQTYANSVQKVNIVGTMKDAAEADSIVEYGFPQEILPGKMTYSWRIPATGKAAKFEIKLAGWNSGLVISNFAIQEAQEIGDTRKLQETVNYLKAVNGMVDGGLSEDLEGLIADAEKVSTNDDATIEQVTKAMKELNESMGEVIEDCIDDYLPNATDKLPMATKQVSKAASIGNWKDDATRIHAGDKNTSASNPAYYDLGHFQYSNGWGNAGSGGRIGLANYGMNLVKGTYIFSVELKANAREFVKNAWSINEGLQFADGILSVINVTDPEKKDTVTTGRYPIAADRFTKKWIIFTVPADGKYDIRIDTYAKEAYDGIKSGSVVYPFGASLYAKTEAKYNKARMDYYNDVVGQITAGRTNITTGNENLANDAKSWGKAALKDSLDKFTPVIEKYETMDMDAIIATYVKGTYDASKGLEEVDQDGLYVRMLASEVYRSATKQLLAANKAFTAQNDTIEKLTAAIADAKSVLTARVYSYATGKDAFKSVIDAAAAKETELRAAGYSVENAAAVLAEIEKLNAAAETFKATLPADKVTSLVDMTGNLSAELGDANWKVFTNKEKGMLDIQNFNNEATDGNMAYAIGFVTNDENLFPSLLRIGNGEADLDFNVTGENILQISFDMYYGKLTGKYAGFYVQKAVAPAEEGGATTYENICSFNYDAYDTRAEEANNTFAIDGSLISAVGSSSESNDKIAAESNKTHFEISMDLATKKMSLKMSSKGNFTSKEYDFEGTPSRFALKCDYNGDNWARRCFFGNLSIKSIAVDETGVNDVEAAAVKAAAVVKQVVDGNIVIKTANGTFNVAGAQMK